jgi:hypothetical protein
MIAAKAMHAGFTMGAIYRKPLSQPRIRGRFFGNLARRVTNGGGGGFYSAVSGLLSPIKPC